MNNLMMEEDIITSIAIIAIAACLVGICVDSSRRNPHTKYEIAEKACELHKPSLTVEQHRKCAREVLEAVNGSN